MSEIKTIPFEEMTAIQRRLHNAAIVLDCEYGFPELLREAINKITELRAALAADDERFEWLHENVDSAITRLNIDLGMQAANQ